MGLFYIVLAFAPLVAQAAPYAAFVMDARTGQELHSENADTRLHPASLTKMMTLYIAFQAIQRGEITLDTEVRINASAAGQPPSRLGLREGQVIRLRYLLRAAAVKSANDAATAIGVAISGSESAFAERMNATAEAMGMSRTHFINMSGLTADGHYSTARDMSVLGRHLIYDFPQYYNLFSRRTADAGIAQVNNTNRRFLDSYEGADGIKTGYTQAAGYNLVASAVRGNVRIIATVFGGTSTANRNARVSDLLDLGFERANGGVVAAPAPAPVEAVVAVAAPEVTEPGAAGRVLRVTGQVNSALRPPARAIGAAPAALVAASDAIADDIASVLEEVTQVSSNGEAPQPPDQMAFAAVPETPVPPERPAEIIMTADDIMPDEATIAAAEQEVIARLSTSGDRHWGVNLGRYNSRGNAERVLIQIGMSESALLEGAVQNVLPRQGGYDANFVGLTRDNAELTCQRLQARDIQCFMLGTE